MAVRTNQRGLLAGTVDDLVDLGGRAVVDKDLMGCIDLLTGVAFAFCSLICR